MSLTREQWVQMWDDIKWIEMHGSRQLDIVLRVQRIKDKIQQVIGQME